MVSLENRNKQIEKLEKLKDKLYIFTEHNKKEHYNTALNMLIQTLSMPEYKDSNLDPRAKEYFNKLTELRT